jgi:hypothetical protein
MRFPKETRALIHKAGINSVTIPWPPGEDQPEVGGTYWLQSLEDVEKAEARREYSPETHADVLAGMHERRYGKKPKRKKKRRRRSMLRPKAGDPRIRVLAVENLEVGWEATVELYEDPDPIRHTGLKTKVKGGRKPIFLAEDFEPETVPTETEPEQLVTKPSRQRRLEIEDALKLEHEASVDTSKLIAAERKVADLRRRGKRSRLAEEAAERARKRCDLASAEGAA